MAYLLLSILASVSNALVIKRSEMHRHDRIVVMAVNYVLAWGLTTAHWAWSGGGWPSAVTWMLGAVGGLFYAGALLLMMVAIATTGLARAAVAMRMSVVWPVLLSLVGFGEVPTPFQAAGIVLALAAVALLTLRGRLAARLPAEQGGWVVLALFVVGGGSGVTLKLFTELGPPAERGALLPVVFGAAAVLCCTIQAVRRTPLRAGDAGSGLLFGTGNVFSNSFLLWALAEVPGVLAFPINNAGVMLLATLAGVLVWRERPGARGYVAVALAALAIVLMRL